MRYASHKSKLLYFLVFLHPLTRSVQSFVASFSVRFFLLSFSFPFAVSSTIFLPSIYWFMPNNALGVCLDKYAIMDCISFGKVFSWARANDESWKALHPQIDGQIASDPKWDAHTSTILIKISRVFFLLIIFKTIESMKSKFPKFRAREKNDENKTELSRKSLREISNPNKSFKQWNIVSQLEMHIS